MSIDETFLLINFICGKNQQGNITPANFNLNIKAANIEYKSFLLGQVEQFQYGNPKARVQLGNNELIISKLSPFIPSPISLTVNNSTGIASKPNDYVERIALYTSSMQKIRWAEQDKLPAYLDDPIDPIATNPIYLLDKDGFQFYPITTTAPKLSYVQDGLTPFWAYNLASAILTFTGLVGGNGYESLVNGISATSVFFAGTAYTNGFYPNVPVNGGTGTGGTVDVTIAGNVVTKVVPNHPGNGYVVGDLFFVLDVNVGGTGSGSMSLKIDAVTSSYLVNLIGGTGSGATANIFVVGGKVTSVVTVNGGTNYSINDILTANIGLGGAGFTITVATISSGQRPTFNASASQDLLWKEVDQLEVIARVLQKVGVNLQAGAVIQYSNQLKNTGD